MAVTVRRSELSTEEQSQYGCSVLLLCIHTFSAVHSSTLSAQSPLLLLSAVARSTLER